MCKFGSRCFLPSTQLLPQRHHCLGSGEMWRYNHQVLCKIRWSTHCLQSPRLDKLTRIRALDTPGGSVRFHIPPPATTAPTPKANAMPISQATVTTSKIHDLCKSLVSKSSQNCSIGFLEDQQRRHHLFLVSGPGVQNQIMSEASLHYLLLETHKMVLGPREKYALP